MTFAILADIHGNADALEAVFDDMQALGVTNAVNLGDHFSGPLDASRTFDLLATRNFPSLRGNHDRWLIEQKPSEMGPSDKTAFDQLNRAALDWIRDLPQTLTLFGDVFACHGTPTSDLSYWMERVDDDGTVRPASLTEIEVEAAGLKASLILCAHTHLPRIARLPDGRVIVNPGSVGCPAYDDDHPVFHVMQTGTPNASYALAERRDGAWLLTLRSVPYDSRRMVEMARASGREEWAQALDTGWIDR